MYIRCWGSRGSIPVSGAEYDRYGGDTTCIEIRAKSGDLVILDAGSGIRRLGEKVVKEKKPSLSIVFTHAHLDHVMGVPFFAPMYDPDTQVRIYGPPYNGSMKMRDIIKGIMRGPYCPVDLEQVEQSTEFVDLGSEPFDIGSLHFTSIPLSHPNGGQGYRIEEGGKSFVFLTDNELDYRHPGGKAPADYVKFSQGADLLIHDAEYTPKDYSRRWGHSVFESAVRLGVQAGAKRFGLFHVNQKRTDDEMDAIVAQAREVVSKAGSSMECFGVSNIWELTLE
jgi:phosphoribosyl 1,2-cyclic phosphodiesterase